VKLKGAEEEKVDIWRKEKDIIIRGKNNGEKKEFFRRARDL